MVELLQKIQRYADQKAFKQLYQQLFFRLYQFAYSFIRSKESAEEVVNDVFMGLWQKRDSLDQIRNIQVFLYVAVRNASMNYLRKKKLPVPASLDELTVEHIRLVATPETQMISTEMKERVHAAVDGLPARCRLIFKLVKEDGLSYKEVAEILDVSYKTVDTQLYVALKKLSSTLLPLWLEYSPETKLKTTHQP